MNRGVFESNSPVQQLMMAGNPNWWSINNNMRPPPTTTSAHHQNLHHHLQQSPSLPPPASVPFLPYHPSILFSSPSSTTSSLPISIPAWLDQNQIPADSWSHLLLGGFVGGYEEKSNMMMMNQLIQANKNNNNNNKLEMWEEQVLSLNNNSNQIEQAVTGANYHPHHHQESVVDVKQENSSSSSAYSVYGHGSDNDFQPPITKPSWSHQIMPPPPPVASSPTSNNKSSITTTSPANSLIANNNNSMLDFATTTTKADISIGHPPPDRSHQCNNSGNGGAVKKARTQTSSSSQSSGCFKVRKEKLGDRITALHQLVSPFGKTDTASVLLEAIGYIRFLQSQVEALSLPYLNGGSGNVRQQQSAQGERNCIFPEDPGQLLNDNFVKRKGAPDQQDALEEPKIKNLRSRGLCLVPVSCTLQVSSDNGADYWAPAFGGGGFR